MLSQDVLPSRTNIAHQTAINILESIPDSHVGVASFSGNLTLLSPYTPDHQSVVKAIKEAQPDIEFATGSDLGRAVKSILNILSESQTSSHSVVILSDGEKHDHEIAELDLLKAELFLTPLKLMEDIEIAKIQQYTQNSTLTL